MGEAYNKKTANQSTWNSLREYRTNNWEAIAWMGTKQIQMAYLIQNLDDDRIHSFDYALGPQKCHCSTGKRVMWILLSFVKEMINGIYHEH